jgi:hypothetical protein
MRGDERTKSERTKSVNELKVTQAFILFSASILGDFRPPSGWPRGRRVRLRLGSPRQKSRGRCLRLLGRLLRCRNSLVFQSILLRFDASNPGSNPRRIDARDSRHGLLG